MANSILQENSANLPTNTLTRTNKEQIGSRVIRGTDWKWGKQVRALTISKFLFRLNSIIPRWPKFKKYIKNEKKNMQSTA